MGLMQGVQLCMAYEADEGVLFGIRPVFSEFQGWSQVIETTQKLIQGRRDQVR